MKKQNEKLKKSCSLCGDDYIISRYAMEHRKIDSNFCFRCYDSSIRRKLMLLITPQHLYSDIILNNQINFDEGVKYLGKNFKCKIFLFGSCSICGINFRSRYDKLKGRKVYPFAKLCTKCVREETCRSEVARESNRKAQLITQNLPHIKNNNSMRSKRYWKSLTKTERENLLKPFTEQNEKIKNDPEYSSQIRKSSGLTISGRININGKWIEFDSGYELLYLNYIKNMNDITIRRCDFVIPYGKYTYNPDFLIINNDKKTIVEIKGYYKNRIEEKEKAAISFVNSNDIADEYCILGILEKESSVYVWKQIRKIYDGQNIKFTHDKHREIAAIGRSRFNRNRRNSLNRILSL
jgi:hypothetical protein